MHPHPPENLAKQYTVTEREDGTAPSVLTTLSVILLPVAIMLVKTVVDIADSSPNVRSCTRSWTSSATRSWR